MDVQPSVRYFIIDPAGNLSLTSTLSDALAGADHGGYLWADYLDPTNESLAELATQLKIHPLSLEDCLNEEQLPKLDVFPDYSFMIFNYFEITTDMLAAHELDLFLGARFLITVSRRDSQGWSLLADLHKGIERDNLKIRQGPSFLMHLIIDNVVDRKFNALEMLEEKLDEDEDEILNRTGRFDPASLMATRRQLLVVRKAVFYEREVLGKLIRMDSPFIADKSIIYFRDIYDHLSKYYEISETARDLVTSLLDIHLSIASNRMAETANRTNAIMRRLTLITTIFMPLTLISGIGGMSEYTMMIGQENWKWGYVLLLVLMGVIATVNYLFLARMEKQLPEDGN